MNQEAFDLVGFMTDPSCFKKLLDRDTDRVRPAIGGFSSRSPLPAIKKWNNVPKKAEKVQPVLESISEQLSLNKFNVLGPIKPKESELVSQLPVDVIPDKNAGPTANGMKTLLPPPPLTTSKAKLVQIPIKEILFPLPGNTDAAQTVPKMLLPTPGNKSQALMPIPPKNKPKYRTGRPQHRAAAAAAALKIRAILEACSSPEQEIPSSETSSAVAQNVPAKALDDPTMEKPSASCFEESDTKTEAKDTSLRKSGIPVPKLSLQDLKDCANTAPASPSGKSCKTPSVIPRLIKTNKTDKDQSNTPLSKELPPSSPVPPYTVMEEPVVFKVQMMPLLSWNQVSIKRPKKAKSHDDESPSAIILRMHNGTKTPPPSVQDSTKVKSSKIPATNAENRQNKVAVNTRKASTSGRKSKIPVPIPNYFSKNSLQNSKRTTKPMKEEMLVNKTRVNALPSRIPVPLRRISPMDKVKNGRQERVAAAVAKMVSEAPPSPYRLGLRRSIM